MNPVLDRDVAWIRHTRAAPGTLRYAIPADFAVYGVLDLPDSIGPVDEALLTALAPLPAEQLVAGWIDRGPWPPPAGDEHTLYAGWRYRFRRVRASELRGLPTEGEGSFPDLLFPPDHSWLMSLLWDDSWRSIGATEDVGQRLAQRVPAFEQLSPHADLAATGREPN